MSRNESKNAVRRARRARKLGANARCAICGVSDPAMLVAVGGTTLEVDHVLGRSVDPSITWTLCRNHHALLTDKRVAAAASMERPATILHLLTSVLPSQGVVLNQLTERSAEWSEQVAELIERLDSDYPAWRDLPEARS
jgi:hypothetical protein